MADSTSSTKVPEADIREGRDELAKDREGRSSATRAYALNCSMGLTLNVGRGGLFASRSHTSGVALPAISRCSAINHKGRAPRFFAPAYSMRSSIDLSTDFIAVERGQVKASKTEPLSYLIVRSDQHATVINVDIAPPEQVDWVDPLHPRP